MRPTRSRPKREDLFQAALADQTIFDALQEEQALRDLFDDPSARAAILAAAEAPRRARWYRTRWPWVGAGAAAAMASAVLIWMPRTKIVPPVPPTHAVAQKAERAVEAREATPAVPKKSKARRVRERSLVAAAPAPPPAAPAAEQAAPLARGVPRGTAMAFRTMVRVTPETVVLREDGAGQFVALGDGPLARGDRVRIRLHARTAEHVALYKFDESGVRTLIYPDDPTGVALTPGQDVELPAAGSIAVTGALKLELSVASGDGSVRTIPIELQPQ